MKTSAFLYCVLMLLHSSTLFSQIPPPRPNIILIIGDDMRYDSFLPTGGPSWFDSPSINRIASEGANFQNYFCVYSLCIPARSSMMTGLYPHSNGATDNISTYHPHLPTVASILDSAGYNTAMIGKYHAYSTPQPGWDYWMAKSGHSEDNFEDVTFNVNGEVKTIPGHVTQVIKDSVYQILSVIDTPFFICIGHQAPHKPAVPLPENAGIYADEEMPIPSNFYKYLTAFPSFLYEDSHEHTVDELGKDLQDYYECLKDIDENVEDIFSLIQSRKVLDETMILFTADNGFLYGEHVIEGKGLPYDPSIRLPMFIRFPGWFESNTVLDAGMGLNVDIAPTLLEAAGIDDAPYHFHGVSLRKLASGEIQRDKILYENIKLADALETVTPSVRTVRSTHYKYNRYQCTEQTEEFFDLAVDPHENINLINDEIYKTIIGKYRNMLDSLRIVFNDTLAADTLHKPCHLVNTHYSASYAIEDSPLLLEVGPNPFSDQINLKCAAEDNGVIHIAVYNQLGVLLFSEQTNAENGFANVQFDSSAIPPGIYSVRVAQGINRTSTLVLKN